MSDARRYTLPEAERALALRECAMHGHDWDVIVLMGGRTTQVICRRCGVGYRVESVPVGRSEDADPA